MKTTSWKARLELQPRACYVRNCHSEHIRFLSVIAGCKLSHAPRQASTQEPCSSTNARSMLHGLTESPRDAGRADEDWVFASPSRAARNAIAHGASSSGGSARRLSRRDLGESIDWHTFRHTFRTPLDEIGAPLKVQQELMRHADIRTTMTCAQKRWMKASAAHKRSRAHGARADQERLSR